MIRVERFHGTAKEWDEFAVAQKDSRISTLGWRVVMERVFGHECVTSPRANRRQPDWNTSIVSEKRRIRHYLVDAFRQLRRALGTPRSAFARWTRRWRSLSGTKSNARNAKPSRRDSAQCLAPEIGSNSLPKTKELFPALDQNCAGRSQAGEDRSDRFVRSCQVRPFHAVVSRNMRDLGHRPFARVLPGNSEQSMIAGSPAPISRASPSRAGAALRSATSMR